MITVNTFGVLVQVASASLDCDSTYPRICKNIEK